MRIILVFVFGLGSFSAQTVEILPTADNTIFEYPGFAVSNGAGPHLYVGRTNNSGGSSARRGLLRFDLAGVLPSDATILEVSLHLTCSSSNGGASTVSLHRLLASFGEGTSNSGSPGGTGAMAVAPDATWSHAQWPTMPWANSGGDFETTALAAVNVTGPGVYTWGPNPALTSDAQQQLQDPQNAHGWLIRSSEIAGLAKRFDTRESRGTEPRLRILYGRSASVSTSGSGCGPQPGNRFRWTNSGTPALGQAPSTIGLLGGPPFGGAFLILADALASAPLALGGGCNLYLDLGSSLQWNSAGLSPLGPIGLDGSGSAQWALPLPFEPGWLGLTLHAQAVVPAVGTPTGFHLSDVISLRLGL